MSRCRTCAGAAPRRARSSRWSTRRATAPEAIAWAAALEGSNGAVGTYGFSYQGTNQLLAATLAGPALKAMAPAMIGWDLANDWAYEGGGFNLAANLGWALQLEAETARRAGDRERHARIRAAAQALPLDGEPAAWPPIAREELADGFYERWLDRADADYWASISPAASLDAIAARNAPALFVGGWFDSHLPGTISGYRALADRAARLVIGPWAHFPWDRRIGTLDYGADAVSDIDRLQVAWFKHWLEGEPLPPEPRVRLFDLGTRQWRAWPGWPPRDDLVLHLRSSGRASLDGAEGHLGAMPDAVGEDLFVHDPWRPAPAVGGAYGQPVGPADRTFVDARADVLTYTSAPFEQDVSIAGDILAELAVTADTPSFDIACTLSHITSDGVARAVTTGFLANIRPGGRVMIALRATCLTIALGERLRLAIAAAAFPAHPVNPGNGETATLAWKADAQVITIRVALGGDGGSRLRLPQAVEAQTT